MIGSRSDSMSKLDFLQMLTAQLKAQDPMNPMDSQNFAAQLAQFSSLQELQNMDTTMTQSLQANLLLSQTFSNTMATSLIGKTVQANVDKFSTTATGTNSLSFNLGKAATDITIEIKDSGGTVIRTATVPAQTAGDHSWTWDGLDGNGKHVAAGDYTFSLTAKDVDGNSVAATTVMTGRVTGVRYEDGNVLLVVNGMDVQLGQIMSINESESKKG
jgi:flagellar basal-body rod modification protein FlgD